MADTPAQGFQDFGARLKAVTSGLLWVDMGIVRTTLGSRRAFKRSRILDFPGAPVVRTQLLPLQRAVSILDWETNISHGTRPKKKSMI